MGNSAAALFADGRLIAAVEEERISRLKNDGRFPYNAMKEVLSIAGITIEDVSDIAVYWRPWNLRGRLLGVAKKASRNPIAGFELIKRAINLFVSSSKTKYVSGKWSDLFFLRSLISAKFGKCSARFHYIEHHLSHQLYAEAMRNWDNSVSLSYDGGGEEDSTIVSFVSKEGRSRISYNRWPNSLGHFYSTFTGFLGFKMLEGEYKMMGLAPYGSPIYKDLIMEKILKIKSDGNYQLNTKICDYHEALRGRFNNKLIEYFGKPRSPNEEPTRQHIDLACSVQASFEEAQSSLLRVANKRYPEVKNLVLSGGCALNVTANGKVLTNSSFENIIIPPAPHDAGCAIGACIAIVKHNTDLKSVRTPYLGRKFTISQIEHALNTDALPSAKKFDEISLIDNTAQMLADGKIVAWFQGAAEFGPRALGNRSFLADPRKDEIREEINIKIKKRELFRPFAPSVLFEESQKFFDISQDSPYMNIVARVINKRIPAVTHIDGTARVHTVKEADNYLYYRLIKRFGALTGIPVILNTSFNIQEPIVYSPQNAVDTFVSSEVDALVIGNYIVRR